MKGINKELLIKLVSVVKKNIEDAHSLNDVEDNLLTTNLKIKEIVDGASGIKGRVMEIGDFTTVRQMYNVLAEELNKELKELTFSSGSGESTFTIEKVDNVLYKGWPVLYIEFAIDKAPEEKTKGNTKSKSFEYLTENSGVIVNKGDIPTRIFLRSFRQSADKDLRFINSLMNLNESKSIEVCIDSPGGSLPYGITIIELLKDLQAHVDDVKFIIMSRAYSMGSLVFLVGKVRIVNEHSSFMLHNYSSMMHGKGGELNERLKHDKKQVKRLFKELVVKNKYITKKEFKLLKLGKDYWFDTKEMCKRGIATHVKVNGELVTAKKYLNNF